MFAPETLSPGMRVRVPFGTREMLGVLLSVNETPQVAIDKLKPALEVIDETPLLSPVLLRLCQWIHDYYHHPIGEVMAMALPKLLRQARPATIERETCFVLTELGEAALVSGNQRAKKQIALLESVKNKTALSKKDLRDLGFSSQQLKAVVEKKWLAEQLQKTGPISKELIVHQRKTLNAKQQQAVEAINAVKGFAAFLLQGVTGSGKTEVYLQAIEKVLGEKKQALVLVPEIGLTPQTVRRFANRFNVAVGVLHSELSDSERMQVWLKAKAGHYAIIIGTRSAIFTPLPALGIIIVDEEHDLSFKQQSGCRYSARDVAVVRARFENIPVVLGSATPSLESFYNVERQRYQLLQLPERAGDAKPPTVRVVDCRKQSLNAGMSETLINDMRRHLDAGGQVMLFLNRRGYAPVLMCHGCGDVMNCPRCDAKLTLHQFPKRLVCHHCEFTQKPLRICQSCHQSELMPVGQGTARIEEALVELFPDRRVLRVDRDTTSSKNSLAQKLKLIQEGKADILIGTQMLAKGHHFPNLTLSVILDADSGLFSIDFRAIERMAQLIVQVAGRSGREEKAGEVIIQTHQPEHPALQLLLKEGFAALAKKTLQERRHISLPPFNYLVLVRARALKQSQPVEFLKEARALLEEKGGDKLTLLGPVPAPMEKKAGRFRSQLLIQSASRADIQKYLTESIKTISELPSARRVSWSVDVDPLEIF